MDFEVVNKIEMRKISEIKPYFRNPRKNDKTVELLVQMIPKVGFNVPLTIDRNGVIVKGHARYTAAIRLGMTELPCVVTEADEETIKLDRLSDNKISEFSQWDKDELLHELDSLDIQFDISDLEFPEFDFGDIPAVYEDDDEIEETEDDRRARYERWLEEHQGPSVTEEDIARAEQRQREIPQRPKRYYKVTCEHCGHVMFIEEGSVTFTDE
jgi:hypothetical protein